MQERIFTFSEASALIPRLRSILEEVVDQWNRVKSLNPQIQKARDKAQFDGGSPYGVEYIETITHLMMLLQQVRDLGVLLKDVDKGLCDFPYMKNGRVVYLCWQLGEEAIGFWHDIEAGFGGRDPWILPIMNDRILIHGMDCQASLGVTAEERKVPQRLSIDLEMFVDSSRPALSDSIDDAINYSTVAAAVNEVCREREYHLIETMAERIADRVLSGFPLPHVRVLVRKISPIAEPRVNYVSIEIVRSRA